MRIGFVSHDREPYERSMEVASDLGFDYVELMMDGDARREVLEQDRESTGDSFEEHGLDALVHLPYPLLIGSPHRHQREGAVEEVKRCIDAATAFGAEKGVLHPDSYGWRRVWEDDELHSLVVDSVRELDEYASEREFEVCVENHGSGSSIDVTEFDVILEETEASMTFDTGHAAIAGMNEQEMVSFLTDNRERVSHLHLNDTRHPDDGYQGRDEHLPLGYGSLDFEIILDPLVDGDWDGTLSIELDTGDFGYLETSKRRLDEILP